MVFFFIVIIMFLLLITSKIRIEVENVKLLLKEQKEEYCSFTFKEHPKETNKNDDNRHYSKLKYKIKKSLNDTFKIKIKLVVFKKIPIIWFTINKERIQKIKQNNKLKNMNFKFKNIQKNITKNELKKIAKQIEIQIEKFYLNFNIGTDSPVLTSMLIPIISTMIAVGLARKKVKKINQNYKIKPIYNNRKLIKYCFFRYI